MSYFLLAHCVSALRLSAAGDITSIVALTLAGIFGEKSDQGPNYTPELTSSDIEQLDRISSEAIGEYVKSEKNSIDEAHRQIADSYMASRKEGESGQGASGPLANSSVEQVLRENSAKLKSLENQTQNILKNISKHEFPKRADPNTMNITIKYPGSQATDGNAPQQNAEGQVVAEKAASAASIADKIALANLVTVNLPNPSVAKTPLFIINPEGPPSQQRAGLRMKESIWDPTKRTVRLGVDKYSLIETPEQANAKKASTQVSLAGSIAFLKDDIKLVESQIAAEAAIEKHFQRGSSSALTEEQLEQAAAEEAEDEDTADFLDVEESNDENEEFMEEPDKELEGDENEEFLDLDTNEEFVEGDDEYDDGPHVAGDDKHGDGPHVAGDDKHGGLQ